VLDSKPRPHAVSEVVYAAATESGFVVDVDLASPWPLRAPAPASALAPAPAPAIPTAAPPPESFGPVDYGVVAPEPIRRSRLVVTVAWRVPFHPLSPAVVFSRTWFVDLQTGLWETDTETGRGSDTGSEYQSPVAHACVLRQSTAPARLHLPACGSGGTGGSDEEGGSDGEGGRGRRLPAYWAVPLPSGPQLQAAVYRAAALRAAAASSSSSHTRPTQAAIHADGRRRCGGQSSRRLTPLASRIGLYPAATPFNRTDHGYGCYDANDAAASVCVAAMITRSAGLLFAVGKQYTALSSRPLVPRLLRLCNEVASIASYPSVLLGWLSAGRIASAWVVWVVGGLGCVMACVPLLLPLLPLLRPLGPTASPIGSSGGNICHVPTPPQLTSDTEPADTPLLWGDTEEDGQLTEERNAVLLKEVTSVGTIGSVPLPLHSYVPRDSRPIAMASASTPLPTVAAQGHKWRGSVSFAGVSPLSPLPTRMEVTAPKDARSVQGVLADPFFQMLSRKVRRK
jgi:hypothetical protein